MGSKKSLAPVKGMSGFWLVFIPTTHHSWACPEQFQPALQSENHTLTFIAHPIRITVFPEALSCSGRQKLFFSLIFVLFHIWFIIILMLLSVELLCHFLSWCAWWLLWKRVYLQVQEDAVGCIFHLANYKSNIYSYKHLHRLTHMLYNFLHREVYSINVM